MKNLTRNKIYYKLIFIIFQFIQFSIWKKRIGYTLLIRKSKFLIGTLALRKTFFAKVNGNYLILFLQLIKYLIVILFSGSPSTN